VAVVFFLGTLYFLSVALKAIDVGIGYAVWAGIGAVGAAVLGPVHFDEHLTLAKAAWLAVIIAGVVWLKLADRPASRAAAEAGGLVRPGGGRTRSPRRTISARGHAHEQAAIPSGAPAAGASGRAGVVPVRTSRPWWSQRDSNP